MPRRRAGRPRKSDAERQPNGRIRYPSAANDNGSDMALLRRAETGCDPKDPRLATPIGVMAAKGLLDGHDSDGAEVGKARYEAALRFEAKHLLARHAMELPSLQAHDSLVSVIASGNRASPVYGIEDKNLEAQIQTCERVLRECYARLCVACGDSGYRLLDDVVLRHKAPPFMLDGLAHPARAERQLYEIRAGLDELARFFKISPRRERN